MTLLVALVTFLFVLGSLWVEGYEQKHRKRKGSGVLQNKPSQYCFSPFPPSVVLRLSDSRAT